MTSLATITLTEPIEVKGIGSTNTLYYTVSARRSCTIEKVICNYMAQYVDLVISTITLEKFNTNSAVTVLAHITNQSI